MRLRVDSMGSGDDLVVLHGWALHCGLFDCIADVLATHFRVHFIDLPGHGHNADSVLPPDMRKLALYVLDAAPDRAHWLGWSLGGMTALMAAAMAPRRVRKLVTVASTPRFVASPDWPRAIPVATLEAMADELKDDFHVTVKNFLSLQVLGDDQAFSLLRELRDKAYAHGEPTASSLANGLKILHDTDLRPQLRDIQSPLLAIAGSRDRLAPPAAAQALANLVADGRSVTIAKAAHAPFISHRDAFLDAVLDFLQGNS